MLTHAWRRACSPKQDGAMQHSAKPHHILPRPLQGLRSMGGDKAVDNNVAQDMG